MLRHFLKLAYTNLNRNPVFSLINVSGLALSMASCILIFLFIQDELKFDKYHEKASRIYRIAGKNINTGEMFGRMSGMMHTSLLIDFPDIEAATRVYAPSGIQLSYNDKQFLEPYFPYVDGSLFKIFDFTFESGNPERALEDPFSMVITKKAAQKYFGGENPIGKTLKLDNEHQFLITGILKEIPYHSHFKFDLFASYSSLETINEDAVSNWDWSGAYIYLLLPESLSKVLIESRFQGFFERYRGSTLPSNIKYELQPLTDIYLHSSDFQIDIGAHGEITYIYGFSIIAFLVLLVACFNLINLSTARCFLRIKEVGIKKVLGSSSGLIKKQFLCEALLFSFISLVVACSFAELFMQVFNNLTEKNLQFNFLETPFLFFFTLVLILGVSILSGYYPALLLSKLQSFKALKGFGMPSGVFSFSFDRFQVRFNQGLLLFQFVISITLTICTIHIYQQINLIEGKDVGFIKDNTIVIENPFNDKMELRYEQFRESVLSNPQVVLVTASFNVPPHQVIYGTTVSIVGNIEGAINMDLIFVDFDFLEKMGVEFIAGRNFSKNFLTDESEAIILNEAAIKVLNLENPLGRSIIESFSENPRIIIGVVKDIYYRSLHTEVRPMLFYVKPYYKAHYIVVKMTPNYVPATLEYLEMQWKKITPECVFQYSFLDQQLERLYRSEYKMKSLFLIFTLIGIFIACLGLFGIALFSTTRRTKEIGIRKILGAPVLGITCLLSKEFVIWIILANIYSWPISYYFLNHWLKNFHYRITIDLRIFLLSGFLVLFFGLLTVVTITVRTALTNPTNIIRNE